MKLEALSHGTAIMLDGLGVLIVGPSGAGKSLLALQLLAATNNSGHQGWLVADDQVFLGAQGDLVLMSAPQNIAGNIELRGRGIVERDFVKTAQLHLVVELVPELERMPETDAFLRRVGSRDIPRCPVPQRGVIDSAHQLLLVEEALRALKKSPQFPSKPILKS